MKRSNKNLINRLPFCVALLLCWAAFASAQSANKDEYPKIEIFTGYSVLGDNTGNQISFGNNLGVPGNYAGTTGFETSVTRNLTRHIGLKGDFSAHFNTDSGRGPVTLCTPICTTATQDIQLKTRVYNFLAGPEFKARNSTRFTPFVYALAGMAHTSATFTSPGPTLNLLLKKGNNGFAMALGGGLDIRATKRMSFRGTMDYNPVFISDSTGGTRDMVRISLGALFHW